MENPKILLVDDEVDLLRGYHKFLTAEGYAVVTAASGQEGLVQFNAEAPDVTVVDLKMPGMDGMAVLKRILARDPDAAVIVFSGYGSIDKAVAALKAGASDFIQKPFDLAAFAIAIEQALKTRRLKAENRALKQVLATQPRFENIIGKSEAMARVFDLMRKVSDLDAPVLITGESGTGKELVARGIHAHSRRRARKAICRAQLRGLARSLGRKRVVRACQGGVHRCETGSHGFNRTCAWGDVFPR